MFDLSTDDLKKRFLDCCPGPSSFNADLTMHQGQVTSVDPMYGLDLADLKNRINDEFQAMLHKVQTQEDRFNWEKIASPEELAKQRQHGINHFFSDFSEGLTTKRYLAENLTALPFDDFSYDIALCSHYLFGGRSEDSVDYHVHAITECARVANEIRIFPLIDSKGETSPLVGPVMLALQQQNFGVEVRSVTYQFQKNGNTMMRVWAHECEVPVN